MTLEKGKFYPVLFVSNHVNGRWEHKKVVNSKAPYDTVEKALEHAYYADCPVAADHFESGYAGWSGSRWVATTAECYYEGQMDNEDFRHPQDELHRLADMRLDNEARGFY